jgi:hypothetical protein
VTVKCGECRHLSEDYHCGGGSWTGPGSESVSCGKGRWYIGDGDHDRVAIRLLVLKGTDCPEFEAVR